MLEACTGGWRIIFSYHPRPTFIKAEDTYLLLVCVCSWLLILTQEVSVTTGHDRYGAYVR